MKALFLSALRLSVILSAMTGCGAQLSQAPESATETLGAAGVPVEMAPVGNDPSEMLQKNRFHLITPTGEKIFAAMKTWETGQVAEAKYYAQPAMCATNASRVLEMAGIKSYSSPLLMTMVNAVRKRGGLVMELPRNRAEIAQKIKTVFNGRIPVGSFVSGCLRPDCSGQAGDGHIALVGDIDDSGYIKIYHNNWYRPDNNPQRQWFQHMIPMDWYNKGFRRKWMHTPWIYLNRDTSGAPQDIQVRLPEIDDLDPTNYYVTLTIPAEILNEVKANKGVITDGKGNVQSFNSGVVAPPKSACTSVKISDPSDPNGVNLRAAPQGNVLCMLPNGTRAELLGKEGYWARVKAQCGGKQVEGFVFSGFSQTFCTQ
ncbi:MAG: SH3 domain-containing protein [Betaproteobacteria bacterium]|nr:SH3 domain-containing protein [Betaproteobacteria bacterium]